MTQIVQNQNQFIPTPILGQVSMIPSPDVASARINPAGTAVYQAGQAVKLIAGTSTEILVDAITGPTDAVVALGVIIFNIRKALYAAGDVCEVASNGSYVWLESSAAIARGATVSMTSATAGNDPQVTTDSTSGHNIIGTAVDTATAAGQLIRVKIAPFIHA